MVRLFPLLLWILTGFAIAPAVAQNGWARDERELVAEYGYCRDCIQWMDADLLGRHFAQIIFESAAQRHTCLGAPDMTRRLFSYLMGNPNVHYQGYFEPLLDEWVQAQPSNSIDPPAIFRQALSLAQGDVLRALLGVYELLKNHARFFNETLVRWFSTYDIRREFFDRFIDLRGDLKERGAPFRGDHAGGWYRMFGMLLYTYHRAISSLPSQQFWLSVDEGPLRNHGRFPLVRPALASIVAEVFKPLLHWKDPDRMKVISNLRGMRIARSLLESLRDRTRLENLPPEASRQWLTNGGKNYGFCARALRWATEPSLK